VPARAVAAPRGRHAPPLAVRQDLQRRRLLAAAASVFAQVGYGEATAEAIARQAGMSKATFYEHFGNKEDCIVALFDTTIEAILGAMRAADERHPDANPRVRVRATAAACLGALERFPDEAQTLLLEIVAAGPRAVARRDKALDAVARHIDDLNRRDFERGAGRRFASPHDALAIVGAVVELASRQIRTGRPATIAELEPVVERFTMGLLAADDPA
jgi:AcrR family transcriptional regulator